MPKPVALITSATGRIGRELVARLRNQDSHIIRACVNSPGKGDLMRKLGAHEIVKLDLTDSTSYGPATEGVNVVYSASLDPLLQGHLDFCAYMGEERHDQIEHVVRVSCMGADTNTALYDAEKHASRAGAGIPLMLQHYWWAERALIEAKLPVTVLRCNFFMNHLLKTDADQIKGEGWFANPLGTARNSFVATRDIAEAGSVCLVEGPASHANKFYDITGPEPQSMQEIASELGRAMGTSVEYKPQSMEQFEIDFGATRAEFFEYLVNGFYTRCSPDFYNITGRRPTTYYEYLTIEGESGETGLEELWQGNLWEKGVDAMKDAAKTVA